MKFNIGDKVIKEDDLDFLFNPYWKDKYRKSLIQTVTEANDKVFAIYNEKGRYNSTIENGYSCGMNNYLIYFQLSGYQDSWPHPTKLLHLEKDKEYIINKVENIGKETYEKDNQNVERQIAYYKAEKKRINEIYLKDLEDNLNLIQ